MNCPNCKNELKCAECGEDITAYFKSEGAKGGAAGGRAKGDCKNRGAEFYAAISKKASKARTQAAMNRRTAKRRGLNRAE